MKLPLPAAYARLSGDGRGILAMAVAQVFFVSMDATAKGLTDYMHPLQVVWIRYLGQTLLAAALLAPVLRSTLRTGNLRLQVIRSALLFATTICYFTAISMMKLGEAATIIHLGPLIIVALAGLALGEKVGPRRWTGVLVGFLGALIVLRPGLGVFEPGAVFALGAAFFVAIYQITTRMLGGQDTIWTTMLYTTALGTLLATTTLPFVWVTPPLEAVPGIVAVGCFGMVAHLLLVWALSQAEASTVAPFNYLGIVWAVVFGVVFFAELPDAFTFAGAGVIVGAGLYVWHRERMRARRGAA